MAPPADPEAAADDATADPEAAADDATTVADAAPEVLAAAEALTVENPWNGMRAIPREDKTTNIDRNGTPTPTLCG